VVIPITKYTIFKLGHMMGDRSASGHMIVVHRVFMLD